MKKIIFILTSLVFIAACAHNKSRNRNDEQTNLTKGIDFKRTPTAFFTNKKEEIILNFDADSDDIKHLERAWKEYGVGLILPEGCPATIIQKRFVLTAAHCVVARINSKALFPWSGGFLYAENKDTHIAAYAGEAEKPVFFTGLEYVPKDFGLDMTAHTGDYVIFKLYEKIESALYINISNAKVEDFAGKALISVGMPNYSDSERKIVIDEDCRVISNFHDNVFNIKCSAFHGSSGGPIFIQPKSKDSKNIPNHLEVVGIMTGMKSNNLPGDRIQYSDDVATYGPLFIAEKNRYDRLKKFIDDHSD